MKSLRLLPIVIFAAIALLMFKGVGLISSGSYVLSGVTNVAASEGAAAPAHEGEGDAAAPPAGDVTMTDTSPMLTDAAPTIGMKPEAVGEHGGEAAPAAHGEGEATAPEAEGEHAPPAPPGPDKACPESEPLATSPSEHADMNDKIGNAFVIGCRDPVIPTNAHGDALPTTKDGNGKIVPLASIDGSDSGAALLERLSERRSALDQQAADLDMREALIAAAEQRIDERSAALATLEAKINALVDEKAAAEDAQFKAVVGMYEQMKAKDAANIFDALNLDVLVRVARAMNPRKMAPILAAMSAQKARDLTSMMAAPDAQVMADAGRENLAALPQIVGR